MALVLFAAVVLAACTVPASLTQPSAVPVSIAQPASATTGESASGTSSEAANLAVVKRFYDEYAAGNADVILDTHAVTITMHYAGEAEPVPAQVLAEDLAALMQTNPDLHAEVHDMFASGDYVFTELTWTTTHTGDYFGIPATGKTARHPGIVVRQLEEGKIVESWEMFDDLAFLNSLGYVGSWDEIVASGGPTAPNQPKPAPAATPTAASLSEATPAAQSSVELVKSITDGPDPLRLPVDLALDPAGNLFLIDSANQRIVKFGPAGVFVRAWGSRGAGEGQFNLMDGPDGYGGVAVDRQGNVYVADTHNARVQKFSGDGKFLLQWGDKGRADGQFMAPLGITVDGQGNIYVGDYGRNDIQKFDAAGRFLLKWGGAGSGDGRFDELSYLAVDSQGDIYAADTYNHRIQKFDPVGRFLAKWGQQGLKDGEFQAPYGIALDADDNVYVAEYKGHRVQKFDPSGHFLNKWRALGSGDLNLQDPSGLAVSADSQV